MKSITAAALSALLVSFVSTRTVQATPLNRQDYNDLRGWEVPSDENPNDDGYLVVNAGVSERNVDGFDGYVSWLPKLAFEEQYKPNGTPIERMQIEADELDDKLAKLEAFINKDKPDFLSEVEWDLLRQQAEYMALYLDTLKSRLELATDKIKNS